MNVLLITLDQFRGDCLSAAGHPVVRTPHLDALGRQGVRFSRHYSQAAPCAPGRACLYSASHGRSWCSIHAIRRSVRNAAVVDAFTENVDLFPTICDAIGLAVPAQCDGLPLTSFLRGEQPVGWRTAAHWEFDWRSVFISPALPQAPFDRMLERNHLAVLRSALASYVQFGDGSWCAFDLAADPTWRTELSDPTAVLALAQAMLLWRSSHAERTLTGLLLVDGGMGRWPALPEGWAARRPRSGA